MSPSQADASRLPPSPACTSRLTLEAFIEKASGVRYKAFGRDYDGWDCWGVVYCAYRDVLGIALPAYDRDYSSPGEWAEVEALIAHGRDGCSWRAVDSPEAMDVVLLNVGGVTCHIGLVIGGGFMLHCLEKLTTVAERLNSARWASRIAGFYRYRLSQ